MMGTKDLHSMPLPPLADADRRWVDDTLASLDMDACLGQLLCPDDRRYTVEQWHDILRQVPLGCVFFSRREVSESQPSIQAIQAASRVPVVIASDFEHGAGSMIPGQTDFPWAMALGAADDPALAEALGRSTAREARALGYHWTFGPVADIHYNFQNPVTGPRALGDDPARIAHLATAWIRGLQEGGLLAAGAKHFPGDGIDDRDQHLCTSVNSCDMPTWWGTYGAVWKACIDAGTLTIMTGHISLPHWQGCADRPEEGLPATLDPRLQVDLLRGALGFEGVIVSDAAPMLGLASRAREDDRVVQFIAAGGDVYLFCDPVRDYARLQAGVADGRLSPARVREATRRVLELKVRLGLHRALNGPAVTLEQTAQHQAAATAVAENSIVLQRADDRTPLKLKPGTKILTVTVREGGPGGTNRPQLQGDLEFVAEELRARGHQVTHLINPGHHELARLAGEHEVVFVNIHLMPHQRIGTVRLTGDVIMNLWRAFWTDHPCVVFTSFGNPWTLYELPHLPNLWLAWGHPVASQRAAVRAWLGEIPPRGRMPVRMPKLQVDPKHLGL